MLVEKKLAMQTQRHDSEVMVLHERLEDAQNSAERDATEQVVIDA